MSVGYGAIAVDDILDIHKYLKKEWYSINKMFRFIKYIFFTAMSIFSCNALRCVSVNHQECKIRLEIRKYKQ